MEDLSGRSLAELLPYHIRTPVAATPTKHSFHRQSSRRVGRFAVIVFAWARACAMLQSLRTTGASAKR